MLMKVYSIYGEWVSFEGSKVIASRRITSNKIWLGSLKSVNNS